MLSYFIVINLRIEELRDLGIIQSLNRNSEIVNRNLFYGILLNLVFASTTSNKNIPNAGISR